MNPKVQLACAWCGPLFAVVFFAGMLMSGLLPPPSPGRTPAEVAHFWGTHTDLKRFGLFVMMIAAGLTAPFGAVIATQIRRIEGGSGPMTFTQLLGAALGVLAILVPVFVFTATAFRPDRNPGTTQALDDIAWLPFIMNFPPAMMQALSMAVATLGAPRDRPAVFPRWFGYYNIWVTVLFIPGGLVTFFKHGAFAWNGLLAFWLPAVVFGSWFVVIAVVLMKAIKAQAAEAPVVLAAQPVPA